MPHIKLTPAQQWLVHALETLALSAALAVGIVVYQFFSQAFTTGKFDWPTLAGGAVTVLFAVLAKGWSGSIQNNANFLPALFDSMNEVKAALPGLAVVHVVAPPPAPPVAQAMTPVAPPPPVSVPPQQAQAAVTLPPGLFPPGTTFSFGDTGIVPIPPKQ